MSIRFQLQLGLLLIVALGFTVLLDRLVKDVKPGHRATLEDPLVDSAELLAAVAAATAKGGAVNTQLFAATFDRVYKRQLHALIYGWEKTGVDATVYITDARGRVIFDSRDGRDLGRDYSLRRDVKLTLDGRYGARTSHDDGTETTSVMHVAAPILVDGRIIGVLSLGKPSRNVNRSVLQVRDRILTVGLVTGLAIVVLFGVFSRVATRPVQLLASHARAVRDGKKVSLPDLGRNELQELGRAFEEMREALEGKSYVEKYVQTLTHELKSPLCAIQGAVELLDENMPGERRRQFVNNIRNETVRLTALVEKMLLLASLEKQNEIRDLQPIDLGKLADSILADLAPAFEARHVRSHLTTGAAAMILGDAFLIRHALVNLVQNAMEFSPAEGLVAVAIESAAGQARIRVEDSGPGIPAYALARVFERFYSLERPDHGPRSSGLGLSLVKEVVELHKGEVSLTNRPEGGARAEVCFPLPLA